jgi:hypothetical protein
MRSGTLTRVLEDDEVLVLHLDTDEPVTLLSEPCDRHCSADEAAAGPARDIDDLPADQH